MSKIKNILILSLFLLFLGGFGLAGILIPDKEMSAEERRTLEQLPEYDSQQGFSAYMNQMDAYLTDQFPLRLTFRRLKVGFAAYLLGQSDVNGYTVKNGSEFEQIYPLKVQNHEHTAKVLSGLIDSRFSDCQVYYSIIYDKGYYADKGLGLDYETLLSCYQTALGEKAEYIDLSDCLTLEDFYKTDIHWRQECLDKSLSRLSEAMGFELFADGELTEVDAGDFYGVLYGQAAFPVGKDTMVYLTNDLLEECQVTVLNGDTAVSGSVYDTEAFVNSDDSYDLFLGGENAVVVIENPNATGDRNLILFRDSFGRSLSPLMVKSYKQITLVDLRWVKTRHLTLFEEVLPTGENTDVLFLYSAQVLNSMYYE
ncbi:MAG: DHHW family protein [Eubacteriales bacterium]